jgi:hypothetical protein
MIRELDTVVLAQDIKGTMLRAGDVGPLYTAMVMVKPLRWSLWLGKAGLLR